MLACELRHLGPDDLRLDDGRLQDVTLACVEFSSKSIAFCETKSATWFITSDSLSISTFEAAWQITLTFSDVISALSDSLLGSVLQD